MYTSPDDSLMLLVSGVGKLNAALTIGHSLGLLSDRDHVSFLNVGIAASNKFSVGECVMANKVIDVATHQVWYPFLTQRPKAPTTAIRCYDRPQTMIVDTLLDMESAGFMQAVSRLACQDQAQIIKVVSDNCVEDQMAIEPSSVVAWLADAMGTIQVTLDSLLDRSTLALQSYVDLEDYEQLLSRWHFTVYQQYQLKGYLRRWQVVFKDCSVMGYVNACKDTRSVLHVIESVLSNTSYHFE
tara:strand:+ start:935 stop:1657 length:723 start_codon:yes stop_codon:yes gene_type:complete